MSWFVVGVGCVVQVGVGDGVGGSWCLVQDIGSWGERLEEKGLSGVQGLLCWIGGRGLGSRGVWWLLGKSSQTLLKGFRFVGWCVG